MLWRVVVFAVSASIGLAGGELWKNKPGQDLIKASRPVDLGENKSIYEEYGLQAAEEADIPPNIITAYRFKDSTGAVAGSFWLAATSQNVALQGNYVISCTGPCSGKGPGRSSGLETLLSAALPFPGQSKGLLPTLLNYFPEKGQIKHSQRYILGPASLAAFAPQLPMDLFGVQFSPEAEIASYRGKNGDQSCIVISYPTPQMAREQAAKMSSAKLGLLKRSGPLLALVPAPSDPDAAEKLMNQITYRASVQWNESVPVPVKAQSVGQMILAIFSLAGIVLVFCVLSGLAFGSVRILRRRFGNADAGDAMIVLRLQDK